MPSTLSELAATLDELEPAAAMAEAARKALLQKETLALQEILRRVWLVMISQDAQDDRHISPSAIMWYGGLEKAAGRQALYGNASAQSHAAALFQDAG